MKNLLEVHGLVVGSGMEPRYERNESCLYRPIDNKSNIVARPGRQEACAGWYQIVPRVDPQLCRGLWGNKECERAVYINQVKC